ncbi:17769_t:CDS:2, partial [Funneliformis caledonium]
SDDDLMLGIFRNRIAIPILVAISFVPLMEIAMMQMRAVLIESSTVVEDPSVRRSDSDDSSSDEETTTFICECMDIDYISLSFAICINFNIVLN